MQWACKGNSPYPVNSLAFGDPEFGAIIPRARLTADPGGVSSFQTSPSELAIESLHWIGFHFPASPSLRF